MHDCSRLLQETYASLRDGMSQYTPAPTTQKHKHTHTHTHIHRHTPASSPVPKSLDPLFKKNSTESTLPQVKVLHLKSYLNW